MLDKMKIQKSNISDFTNKGKQILKETGVKNKERFHTLVGILNHMFDSDFINRRIIDLASGGDSDEYSEGGYGPDLCGVLHELGAKPLAVDRYMLPEKNFPFEVQKMALSNFVPEEIRSEWHDCDIALSTSFIGMYSDNHGIDVHDFIKKIKKISDYQIHAILYDDNESGEEEISLVREKLTNDQLESLGLEVIYNGTQSQESDDVIYHYLILRKNE